ncbi:MAG: hypothetical protein ACRC6E_01720 [Fusobacteriaceae bacterium]
MGDEVHVKGLGDVSMYLHEYAHVLHFYYLKPNQSLLNVLNTEQPIPSVAIKPNYANRELQDFIATATRWKVKYPFKHNKNCNVELELLANLFVIFTLGGEDLKYIERHFQTIHNEYSYYYNSLDSKNKTKFSKIKGVVK